MAGRFLIDLCEFLQAVWGHHHLSSPSLSVLLHGADNRLARLQWMFKNPGVHTLVVLVWYHLEDEAHGPLRQFKGPLTLS